MKSRAHLDPVFEAHDPGALHQESPGRLRGIRALWSRAPLEVLAGQRRESFPEGAGRDTSIAVSRVKDVYRNTGLAPGLWRA